MNGEIDADPPGKDDRFAYPISLGKAGDVSDGILPAGLKDADQELEKPWDHIPPSIPIARQIHHIWALITSTTQHPPLLYTINFLHFMILFVHSPNIIIYSRANNFRVPYIVS